MIFFHFSLHKTVSSCDTWIYLGFSARLKIRQVPSCDGATLVVLFSLRDPGTNSATRYLSLEGFDLTIYVSDLQLTNLTNVT